jgi:DNA-binding Lrp family transcriptional regulator
VQQIDKTDRRILEILQNDGRLTNQEIAERAGVSAAACWRRMRALESSGVISRYTALLERRALDLGLCIFVQVSLSRHESSNVAAFEEAVVERPEVLECHATTGDADFLLKVVTRDIGSYDQFLEEFLFRLPGISHVRSNITLREIKSDTRLPVPA